MDTDHRIEAHAIHAGRPALSVRSEHETEQTDRSLFAELGTVAVFPIAVALGMTEREAASVALIGGADGPMVLFASLILAKDLFVPITVVGYLYLGLAYGGYPYLIKLLIPERLRAIPMPVEEVRKITSGQKLMFAVVICTLMCLLFPVAAPLFLSLFIGVAVRESGLVNFSSVIGETFLYGATFFLGLTLGVLCEASTILNPVVLKLLLLGMLALLLSGIGGIIGGYALHLEINLHTQSTPAAQTASTGSKQHMHSRQRGPQVNQSTSSNSTDPS